MGTTHLEPWQLVGAYPVCSTCGSQQVLRDAWASWDKLTSKWTLLATFDDVKCEACGKASHLEWKRDEEFRKKRIRRLNDAIRKGDRSSGMIVATSGLTSAGDDFMAKAFTAVADFEAFSEENDPYNQHDFGSVEIEGEKVFWKIDYFDLELKCLSPDPANPTLTNRVLTIMLAHEY